MFPIYRYFIPYLIRGVMIALPIVAGWWLTRGVGPLAAIGIGAAFASISTALGALLLHTSKLGQVTWKNRVGSWLVPWGYRIGRGRLVPIAITSAVLWLMLETLGVLIAFRGFGSIDASNGIAVALTVLMILAWIVDGGCLVYLAGNLSRNWRPGSRMNLTLFKIVGVLLLMIGVSVGLWMTNHPLLAVLVAGGPPLAIGGMYGVFLGVILTAGRNARWN